MAKGIILLADGFEETEGIAVHDILTRAGIILKTVSISDSIKVVTSFGLSLDAAGLLKDEDLSSYDFIVLPGGKKGVANLGASEAAINAVKYFHDNGKLVCAICAAPSILGKLGYLDGKSFTCFPGFEAGRGNKDMENGTVTDGKIITGRSMYFAVPFAESIVRYYLGQKGVDRIYFGTRGAELPE